ncbi:hypothetical protein Poli38472_010447 [Pythium oligandrum]|uniref:Vacuolar fusion protein MON1 homolog n=1 Tax=Pythium oligandrum TaxID=41045 RepID=A0A8K1C358_PYTOL|nr:hypothetical protein Poli38472_010447 [Pythium oligandrum]|eukprot:TMW55565.1 hypothetical protein Poli38472_010447 [Pythium oligandrum]
MEVELVVCSSSGKPIFHYRRPADASHFEGIGGGTDEDGGTNDGGAHSFVSSLQGVLSFVSCMQQEELQEIETDGCRAIFHSQDGIISYAAIVRVAEGGESKPISPTRTRLCLERMLQLMHAQILFILSDRGLDVLRHQPGYDLRELLIGTERVIYALSDQWATDVTVRFKDFGVRFVRLHPDDRMEIMQTLEHDPSQSSESSGMICGLLLASGKVVAVAQPMKKQFSILVDDLLLLINFVYHTPSFTKSETWTPVCFPSFNSRGFLHAYIAFIAPDIALVLLSTQQSPAQFHQFQGKRAFIQERLQKIGAIEQIHESMAHMPSWKPHCDLPLLHHFIYKNEITGECASPSLEFPFDDPQVEVELLDQYAQVLQLMFPSLPDLGSSQVLGKRRPGLQESAAARLVVHRTTTALYIGLCSDEYRFLAWFDGLIATPDAQDQSHLILDRLKRDEELLSVSHFISTTSLWP